MWSIIVRIAPDADLNDATALVMRAGSADMAIAVDHNPRALRVGEAWRHRPDHMAAEIRSVSGVDAVEIRRRK